MSGEIKLFADRPHRIAIAGREVEIEPDDALEGAYSVVISEDDAVILEGAAKAYKKQTKEDFPYRVVRPAPDAGGNAGDTGSAAAGN